MRVYHLPVVTQTPENTSKKKGTHHGEEKADNIVEGITPIRAVLFPRACQALLPKGLSIFCWKRKIFCIWCWWAQLLDQDFITSAVKQRTRFSVKEVTKTFFQGSTDGLGPLNYHLLFWMQQQKELSKSVNTQTADGHGKTLQRCIISCYTYWYKGDLAYISAKSTWRLDSDLWDVRSSTHVDGLSPSLIFGTPGTASKYSISLWEWWPRGPAYTTCPPCFSSKSCNQSQKKHHSTSN